MKTELTVEQSKHLIDLGVQDFPSEVEMKDGKLYSVFTLTDLLEILPKEEKVNNSTFNLEIHFYNDIVHVIYCIGGIFPLAIKESKELIDALYELTVWCIENGYLKF